jgi:cardiolipin synthase
LNKTSTQEEEYSYFKALGVANILTICRMFLIPVFVIASVYHKQGLAFVTFVIAGITDFLDGYLARHTKHVTDVGKILDPMADKVMLISVYVILALDTIGNLNVVPLWFTILVIFRDVFIAIVSVLIYFTTSVTTLLPSIIGKITTFFQITTASLYLFCNAFKIKANWLIYMVYLAAFFTLLSGFHYLLRGVKGKTNE